MSNVETVFQDKEFVERVLQMTPEDAVEEFRKKGIECTREDLVETRDLIKAMVSQSDELSEEQLEIVSGGGAVGDFARGAAKGFVAVLGAIVIGLAIASSW